MSSGWKDTLAAIAPTIASALGGPLAGLAVHILSKALGLSETSEEAVAAAITGGDPDTLVKLKHAETQFKVEAKRLDVDLERIHAGDRASARHLAEKKTLLPQAVLSTVFVAGFVVALYLAFTSTIPEGMVEAVMFLFGILAASLTQIMNFWFGSSSGSARKTDQLAEMARR